MDATHYVHKTSEGIEQYALPSAVHPTQVHYIDREPGGPWELSIVDLDPSISLADAVQLRKELDTLIAFMESLTKSEAI